MNPTGMLLRFRAFSAPRAFSILRTTAILGASAAVAVSAEAQRASVDLAALSTAPIAGEDTLPDAPSSVLAAQGEAAQGGASGSQDRSGGPKQTKRILGIVPNFRAVSAGTKLPPQTVKEKFGSTFQQSFDYSSFLFSAILAGVDQAENSTPQFHQGAAGYGRYYWHTFADQTDENFWVQAIVPALTHEDSRYYTLGQGGIVKRAIYSFDRTLITRSDRGGETFNFSEIVGAGAASGISYLYYPSAEKDWTKTGQRWLENVVIDGGTYVFQEFWPDINNRLFHQKD